MEEPCNGELGGVIDFVQTDTGDVKRVEIWSGYSAIGIALLFTA